MNQLRLRATAITESSVPVSRTAGAINMFHLSRKEGATTKIASHDVEVWCEDCRQLALFCGNEVTMAGSEEVRQILLKQILALLSGKSDLWRSVTSET